MATLNGLSIRHYDNTKDLFDDAVRHINRPSKYGGRFTKLTDWSVYDGKGKSIEYSGYVKVLTDDGDVEAYGYVRSQKNDEYILRRWNEKVDEWNEDDRRVQFSDDLDTFVDEWWLPCFVEIGFGIDHVCLWG